MTVEPLEYGLTPLRDIFAEIGVPMPEPIRPPMFWWIPSNQPTLLSTDAEPLWTTPREPVFHIDDCGCGRIPG